MFDIITDSACDLTLDTAKQLGVEVVPFYVSLDGEHYRKEGKEITVRDFYQFMGAASCAPCGKWASMPCAQATIRPRSR